MTSLPRLTAMRAGPLAALLLCLVAGCHTTPAVPEAGQVDDVPTSHAAEPSCGSAAVFDRAGFLQWSGTAYTGAGQTRLIDADRGGLLFTVGCDHLKGYAVKGVDPACEVIVFNTDAYDAYSPDPLPAACKGSVRLS